MKSRLYTLLYNIIGAASAVVLTVVALPCMAQYPKITDEAKAEFERKEAQWKAHSDSAWAVAWPTVENESREGRPYIPWASRPYDLQQADIPAFPGAEGGGMYTAGGRGGKVLIVENLNDDGPGSFRWACEQGGARTVVFNVSGVIRLESPIHVRAPYITIAGQTAPGDGVCITGESFQIDTHDVVVRHIRFRRGQTRCDNREDSFGGNPVGNIMIDHCSCEWGLDENISFYRHKWEAPLNPPLRGENSAQPTSPAPKGEGRGGAEKLPTVNVTIQNTISAKALDTWNHAFGSTLGGENAAFIRNLWASNTGRNPSIGWYGVFNFVNNVVFNWYHRTADGGDYRAMFNFINNYYKPGPATPTKGNVSHRILKVEGSPIAIGHQPSTSGEAKTYGRVYASGNIMEGNEAVTADNWAGGIQIEGLPDCGEYTDRIRSERPFAMPYINIMNAREAYDYVLANVGATKPCRDAIDRMIIDEVRTGKIHYADTEKRGDMTGLAEQSKAEDGYFKRRMAADSYKLGIITDPAQMGGLPEYHGEPRKDTDRDGMPDDWEKANGLNPNDPSDASICTDGSGYTNIERYINSL